MAKRKCSFRHRNDLLFLKNFPNNVPVPNSKQSHISPYPVLNEDHLQDCHRVFLFEVPFQTRFAKSWPQWNQGRHIKSKLSNIRQQLGGGRKEGKRRKRGGGERRERDGKGEREREMGKEREEEEDTEVEESLKRKEEME